MRYVSALPSLHRSKETASRRGHRPAPKRPNTRVDNGNRSKPNSDQKDSTGKCMFGDLSNDLIVTGLCRVCLQRPNELRQRSPIHTAQSFCLFLSLTMWMNTLPAKAHHLITCRLHSFIRTDIKHVLMSCAMD